MSILKRSIVIYYQNQGVWHKTKWQRTGRRLLHAHQLTDHMRGRSILVLPWPDCILIGIKLTTHLNKKQRRIFVNQHSQYYFGEHIDALWLDYVYDRAATTLCVCAVRREVYQQHTTKLAKRFSRAIPEILALYYFVKQYALQPWKHYAFIYHSENCGYVLIVNQNTLTTAKPYNAEQEPLSLHAVWLHLVATHGGPELEGIYTWQLQDHHYSCLQDYQHCALDTDSSHAKLPILYGARNYCYEN